MIQHIEAYLDGEIPREELQERASDFAPMDLEEEIEWVRNARTAIEMAGLRDQLAEALAETQEAQPRIRSMKLWRPVLAIAAAIALLLAVYLGLNGGGSQPALYAKYEYKAPNLPMLMSQTEHYTLYDALTFYGEEDYPEAIRRLEIVRKEAKTNDTVNFYLGAALLYNQQPAQSLSYLKSAAQADSHFEEQAQWLLVLASLKEENFTQVRTDLGTILKDKGHAFYEEALQLKKDVELQ